MATNSGEKLTRKSCGYRNILPLVYHGSVVRLADVEGHRGHTIDFVETINHHANKIDYSHCEGFSTTRKKHDLG